MVALVDVGAGSIWNRTAQTDAPGETFPFVGAQPPLPPATVPGREDVRAASPAFANSPWAPAYFREFQEQGYETQPFTYTSYRDRSGTYLNIKDNVRVSADAGKGPVVWFFGGSSMFGEGQRDDFTIPSQFARMAADDGHPIRVVNFGVQADSNYQSMLRFEQALASRRPLPSLVVFYDGANEISQHLSQPATDQPQLYQGIYAGGPSSPDADDDVWSAWRRTSLLARALGAASGGSADEPPASEDEIVDQILAVYGRGLRLAQSMAADADAGFASFFQPARFYDETPVADAVQADLPPGTVDLSPVLAGAGDEIYMDEVHTNEEGARRLLRRCTRSSRRGAARRCALKITRSQANPARSALAPRSLPHGTELRATTACSSGGGGEEEREAADGAISASTIFHGRGLESGSDDAVLRPAPSVTIAVVTAIAELAHPQPQFPASCSPRRPRRAEAVKGRTGARSPSRSPSERSLRRAGLTAAQPSSAPIRAVGSPSDRGPEAERLAPHGWS